MHGSLEPDTGLDRSGINTDGAHNPVTSRRIYYGRERGLDLREDVTAVLEPSMVVSMEPMIMIREGEPGAGGYREHDILVVTEDGAEDITGFPYGPEHNIVRG